MSNKDKCKLTLFIITVIVLIIMSIKYINEAAIHKDNFTKDLVLDTTEDLNVDTEKIEITEEPVREDYGTIENLRFIVDITDNLSVSEHKIIGNTSTEKNYSGIIEIEIPEQLIDKVNNDISVGNTYIITTSPILTREYPPQTIMVSYEIASDNDINELETIRSKISNYKECMEQYEKMNIVEIINDANINYATWTQEQINEFTEFIKGRGYTDDNEYKLYANTRNNLNGSIVNNNN